jgi:fatty-acyl-CoA synthase
MSPKEVAGEKATPPCLGVVPLAEDGRHVHTLSSILDENVRRFPHAPAASDGRAALNWLELAALAEGYAALLAARGIGFGDRVALWLPNSVDYLALIFACARLGAIAVHVNTRFRTNEVGHLLERAKARVLVTDCEFAPVDFPALLVQIPAAQRAALECVVGRGATVQEIAGHPLVRLTPAGNCGDRAEPEAPCLTFTTSGTTSAPKLVLHRQRSIARHARDVAQALGMREAGTAALAAVPLCGTFGLAFAMAAAAAGTHILLMDQFDAGHACALIREHKITHAVGSDDMLARIAQAADGRPFESLRFSGFASFTPMAAQNVAAADAAAMMPRGLYGSSEVQALFAFAPDSRRMTDGGIPASPDAEFRIGHPDTGALLPEDEDGELLLRAPSMFDRYLDNPQATARAFTADGYFRSGDLARRVEPGFVYKTRLGDGLRLGGFLVNPEEIESFLQTLPGVAQAQVVAVEHGAQRVAIAFIVARPDCNPNESELLAVCRGALAAYKRPARIVTLQAFPTTDSPNGVKIQRAKLREMASEIMNAGG